MTLSNYLLLASCNFTVPYVFGLFVCLFILLGFGFGCLGVLVWFFFIFFGGECFYLSYVSLFVWVLFGDFGGVFSLVFGVF